jgi:acetyltransferase-like isoleucine patch superfamily enzyme
METQRGSNVSVHYSESELLETFGSVGHNVRVHKSCIILGGKRIHIGSNVRIDCFSLLSAGEQGISIGDHVHIAVGVCMFGSGGRITVGDFAGISARTLLYTATDDYTSGNLTGPTIPDKYRKVIVGDIVLKKHSVIGCASVVMPCTLGLAATVGAMSFVNKDVPDFDVVAGIPAVRRSSRGREVLDAEKRLKEEESRISGAE